MTSVRLEKIRAIIPVLVSAVLAAVTLAGCSHVLAATDLDIKIGTIMASSGNETVVPVRGSGLRLRL